MNMQLDLGQMVKGYDTGRSHPSKVRFLLNCRQHILDST